MTMRIDHRRSIGISAHVKAGKTTLAERILFLTDPARAIHEAPFLRRASPRRPT